MGYRGHREKNPDERNTVHRYHTDSSIILVIKSAFSICTVAKFVP